MDLHTLARIDLNLLVPLQALLEEQSVSRAAERLFLTQPAMSKTLARLRQTFDDPLFVRSAHGIRPTPRALELQQRLQPLLHDLKSLLAIEKFDPSTYKGEFTIAVSEFYGVQLLPSLMAALARQAPHISINNISRVEHQLDELAQGNLDFAVHMRREHYSTDFTITALSQEPPVAVLRNGHPLTGQPFELDQVLNYPIVAFYIPDLHELASIQRSADALAVRQRAIAHLETSHLLTALETVANSDYVMVAPRIVARNPVFAQKLEFLPLPEDVGTIDYVLVSHQSTANSPAHAWLAQQIVAASAS